MLKYTLIILLLWTGSSFVFSQTLNLPARQSNALTGSQFVATISSAGLSLTNRENMIYSEISNGNVPNFYRNLVGVTSSGTVSGQSQSVTYYVIPDYLAVGTDTNYFLCPMSPMLATNIADLTGCTLPTRKMVNDIWSAATVKLSPSSIAASGSMTTVPVFNDHNTTVKGQRNAVVTTYPLGQLVSGDKKDVVISNQIYTNANRVVIYGWHYTSGTAIQPLSNVHADTYMDYSHGIRLVQNAVVYNGTATTVKAILQSGTLNPLLSDEGTMSSPQYPYNQAVTTLSKPVSFAVRRLSPSSLKIDVTNDANASHYKIYSSTSGTTFGTATTLIKTNLILTGLSPQQVYFVKIEAYNQTYNITSAASEVLAATTSSNSDSVLIINGFDRASTGNTYNFVIQHGNAIWNAQKGFSSATNEAISSGLINIQNYYAVDYILGEESSTNETFSTAEQTIMKQYLQTGGRLFVSGSEIGWDLDHLGSAADKDFYNNYLMAAYAYDAPNSGTANSCYTMQNAGGLFTDSLLFDNGTHGTYNVDYPDVFTINNGAIADFTYCNFNETGALHYEGLFGAGTSTGKLVYWGFPFEAVYDGIKRNEFMSRIIDFFFNSFLTENSAKNVKISYLVYPNPSKGVFYMENNCIGRTLIIYDLSGRIILSQTIKTNIEQIDLTNFADGFYVLSVDNMNTKVCLNKE